MIVFRFGTDKSFNDAHNATHPSVESFWSIEFTSRDIDPDTAQGNASQARPETGATA
ncbi:hypothetical protein H1R20_g13674, partial [Candolleomyces eurysporus]